MKRPCIAISAAFDESGKAKISPTYFGALYAAGGVGSIMERDPSSVLSYADEYDGFLFAGGDDIHPNRYGKAILFDSVCPEPERDEFELALLCAAYKTGKPILGICRGMQLINVFFGGTLFQDIKCHMQSEPKAEQPFTAKILKDSLLYSIVKKDEIKINSFHHQAVSAVGGGLTVSATAPDGIAEAIELKNESDPTSKNTSGGFLLGIQWHPELLFKADDSAMQIFTAFIQAAL